MPDPVPDFESILMALDSEGVEFIVVGGVCAVLHGAPVSTFDLDLVISRTSENLARLEEVLRSLNARYREKPEVAPDAHLLDTPGHHLLMTRFGPLDLLGSTAEGEGYGELLEHTERIEISDGIRLKILDLPTLIRLKERLGRERDRAVLPILRRTLEERGEKRDG
jgi:predicted nucleotidyltransferase